MTSYSETYEEETDLHEESSMSFLEHLDELRKRLIRSALFIMIAFVVCWVFADRIYSFLEIPVRAAMYEAQQVSGYSLPDISRTQLAQLPEGTEIDFVFPTDGKIGEVIIRAGATVNLKVQAAPEGSPDGQPQLVTARPLLINESHVLPEGYVIPRALYANSNILLSPDNRLVVGTVQGAFNLYIKVAFYAAIFFAVPFLLTQIWGFVSPGLYPHEKKYAAPFIIMASLFFMLGCGFAYFIAFPRAANFLLGVAAEGNLRPLVSADEYFDLILTIMLGLGVVFEIPTVTFFLSRLGLVTHRLLLKVWRLAVIIIFIVAAVLSPTTDIPNLLVFAAPMMILYFLSVGIAYVFHKKREAPA